MHDFVLLEAEIDEALQGRDCDRENAPMKQLSNGRVGFMMGFKEASGDWAVCNFNG